LATLPGTLPLRGGEERRARVLDTAAHELVRVAQRMRRADHVREREQRILRRERLGVDNVDSRPRQVAVAKRLHERRLIDDPAALC
jgi:hypothetical protein